MIIMIIMISMIRMKAMIMIIVNALLIKVMMPMAGLAFDDPTSKWFTLQDRVISLKHFTFILLFVS